jgi:hypothetical protein
VLKARGWIEISSAGATVVAQTTKDACWRARCLFQNLSIGCRQQKPGTVAGSRGGHKFMAPFSRRRYPGLSGHPGQNQDCQVAGSSPLVARRHPALAQRPPVPSQNHGPRQSPAFARWVPDTVLQVRCCRQSSLSPVSGAGSALTTERRANDSECDSLDERELTSRAR